MKLKFGLELPEAIWWPDIFGDGYEDDILEVIKSGENAVLLYFEDYLNYTAIVNGDYIISGVQNGVEIGDWLVNVNVFGSISNVKAIACTFINKVNIIKKIDSVGPDGLDVVKCRYENCNSLNLRQDSFDKIDQGNSLKTESLQFQYYLDPFEFKEVIVMNSNLIPLLYTLQPGYKDADKWIDQLVNSPDTINWQAAFRYSLGTDKVGACIFDVDQNTGFKVYEKFFTFKVDRIKKVVPGKPYVYQFEYDAIVEEDVIVMEALELPITNPRWLQMMILK